MGILGQRQRRLAWVGFLLLSGYAPIVAWLKPDDTWLMPVAVAGLIGYVIVIDDVLRRRALRTESETTPDHHGDGPGSRSEAPASDASSMPDQRPDR